MCSFHANKKILDLKDFLAPRNADGWLSVPTSTGSFGTHRILPSPRKVPAGGNPIEIIFGSTPPIYTTKHAPTFPRPPIIHPGYVPPIISVIHWKTANGLERDSRFMERVAWQPPKKTSTNHHLSIYYIYMYIYIYSYLFIFHIQKKQTTTVNNPCELRHWGVVDPPSPSWTSQDNLTRCQHWRPGAEELGPHLERVPWHHGMARGVGTSSCEEKNGSRKPGTKMDLEWTHENHIRRWCI